MLRISNNLKLVNAAGKQHSSIMDTVERRRHVQVLPERVGAVAGSDFPGHYPGEDHSWNLQAFKERLVTSINRLTPTALEFDLVGVDASIANALRRVMIAEVPTVAIETVHMWNNTSVMQDEVLAHRLGLVPLNLDPRKLDWPNPEAPTDKNTYVFDLKVTCSRNPEAAKGETDPALRFINSSVKSSHITWQPVGKQENLWKKHGGPQPGPVNKDILLTKLRPGQVIDAELHCVKGIGADHAKFSPVATASYRLLPCIHLRGPIPREHQEKFKACFPPGVVEIEKDANGQNQCVIKNPRKDTVSREVLRHPEFEDLVELTRVRDHFIYQVESTGIYKPEELVPEAIDILLGKIDKVEAALKDLVAPSVE